MKNVPIKHVLLLHKILIEKSGGLHGVKNMGLLESALAQANMSFAGQDLYKNDYEKISAIVYSLATNHPMNDGNKRIATGMLILLCEENGIKIKFTQEELIYLGLELGKNNVGRGYIHQWIINHEY